MRSWSSPRCSTRLAARFAGCSAASPWRPRTPPKTTSRRGRYAVHKTLTRSLDSGLQALHTAAADGDHPALLAHLHALRGAFAMIHEAEPAGLCADMEDAVRAVAGSPVDILARIRRFESAARTVLARRGPAQRALPSGS
ncbi:Hpt domain-containing protein [Burkholderia sp. 22PA0106]|uniref:Hpt domain-containing protein n=1 Tax=Burkholderia sp. 22PA0106 TaxID=3237371 RepID=UPI0039C3E5B5